MLSQKAQYLVLSLVYMTLSLICSLTASMFPTPASRKMMVFISFVFLAIQLRYVIKHVWYTKKDLSKAKKEAMLGIVVPQNSREAKN